MPRHLKIPYGAKTPLLSQQSNTQEPANPWEPGHLTSAHTLHGLYGLALLRSARAGKSNLQPQLKVHAVVQVDRKEQHKVLKFQRWLCMSPGPYGNQVTGSACSQEGSCRRARGWLSRKDFC